MPINPHEQNQVGFPGCILEKQSGETCFFSQMAGGVIGAEWVGMNTDEQGGRFFSHTPGIVGS